MMKSLRRSPDITARVYGGLGNQCFIYATARALADRVHGSLTLDPTVLTFDKVYQRPFLLPEFHVRATKIVRKASFWKLQFRRIHVRAQRRMPWCSNRWLFERTPPRFQSEIANWQGTHATLDGYWQTERYFEDAADAIVADLMPRLARELEATEIAARIAANEHSVFLHVRTYPYGPAGASLPLHTAQPNLQHVAGRREGGFALPRSYFQNAVARMRSEVPKAHFFLFSDDPAWARERLALPPDLPCTPVTPDSSSAKSPILDFHLMTLCRHAIVANSTFSWWAAWLGEQRHRRQNIPGLIVRSLGPNTNADYYPARWQVVKRS